MTTQPFKVEFWSTDSRRGNKWNRKHRQRYYSTPEGMLKAVKRWESKGPAYYCKARLPSAQEISKVSDVSFENSFLRGTKIYSIFGQIEQVVAEAMINEGKGRRIPQHEIPESALFSEDGVRKALFAIQLPVQRVREFEDRIRTLML
jgi:hypothetical protein